MSDVPYPPPDHILRDVGLEVESRADGTATGCLPVRPELLAPGGALEPGVLAILVDVLGGGLAIRSVLPDWTATADLALQLVRADVSVGETVEAWAAVVRKGRTTLVIEVDLRAGDEPLGWGSMTFAVLPRRHDTLEWDAPSDEVARTVFTGERGRLPGPILDAIGAVRLASATVSMPFSGYVRNSFGAVQGGVVAMLGGASGRAALGERAMLDLHVAYLAQARVGPFVARAEVLAPTASTVTIVDTGADDRVAAVVHVGTAA